MTVFCVDFDGTMVAHDYPRIGRDIGAIPVLQELSQKHQVILFTMRTGQHLEEAKLWCSSNNIKLWGVNENPTQSNWSTSRKVFGHVYIDDAALGCPLIHNPDERPYVDWVAVEKYLKDHNYI